MFKWGVYGNKICFVLMIFSFIIMNLYIDNNFLSNENLQEDGVKGREEFSKLRKSGFWEIGSFVINESGSGNFTWAQAKATQPWCSGEGSLGNPYVIENLTINGNNVNSCITIVNSDKYFRIENCTLINSCSGSNAGIYLNNASNGLLVDNNCSLNNGHGIYVVYSENTTILGNILKENDLCGIRVDHCNYNNISRNDVMSNNQHGIFLTYSDYSDIIRNNASDHVQTNYQGIRIRNSNFNNISSNTVLNNNMDAGISLGYCDDHTVSNNKISSNRYGLDVSYAYRINITNNNITSNQYMGVVLTYCYESNIIGNNISNTNFVLSYGMYIYGSRINTISENIIVNNGDYGMKFYTASGINNITNNIISDHTDNGIDIEDNCDDIIIFNNTIKSSTNNGIYIRTGNCNDNIVYFNNFSNNGVNALDDGTSNYWDLDNVGNCWDDYVGSDNDNNGFGDTPYTITGTAGSQDNYPIIFIDLLEPIVYINTPNSSSNLFGQNPPNFNVEFRDNKYLDDYWYTLDNGLINTTFDTNDSINLGIWVSQGNGTVTIRFYANDTQGNIGYAEIDVYKDVIPPLITINNPDEDQEFGTEAPDFDISVTDGNLDDVWYSIDGGATNITLLTYSGTINQTVWDTFSDGPVTIIFYANDTLGNLRVVPITIIKDTSEPRDDDDDNGVGIEFDALQFLLSPIGLFIIGIIAIIGIIVIKKRSA